MLLHEPRTVSADGVVTVSLGGELDLRSADELSAYISQTLGPAVTEVVIDLSAVSYLDVGAARAIITAGHLPSGRPPVLRSPAPAVLRVLVASGLDTHCQISN